MIFLQSIGEKLEQQTLLKDESGAKKRRTRVARLFPSISFCERLVITIAMRIHEEWVSGNKYMTM